MLIDRAYVIRDRTDWQFLRVGTWFLTELTYVFWHRAYVVHVWTDWQFLTVGNWFLIQHRWFMTELTDSSWQLADLVLDRADGPWADPAEVPEVLVLGVELGEHVRVEGVQEHRVVVVHRDSTWHKNYLYEHKCPSFIYHVSYADNFQLPPSTGSHGER